jgi:CBS domain containing-hemolysin-like protein
LGIAGFSSSGPAWMSLSVGILLLAATVATARRMLTGFSRKALLEGLPEAEKARLEILLPSLYDLDRMLRAFDQTLKLALVAALAFATLSRAPEGGGVERFLIFIGVVWAALVVALGLLPAILARVSPEWWVRRLLPPLASLQRRLAPIERLCRSVTRAGARAIGAERTRDGVDVLEEEILSAVEEGERTGIFEEGEISMIESIIRFRDREVSEVMTPRTEMVCIDLDESLEESLRVAIECGHSRIPVYQGTKDNIVGILYVKDLLRFWKKRESGEVLVRDIIRQPHFIPESKKISELFHDFRSRRFHIAISLDEFGGTSGLITIEDIIEEIVGEIVDEFEKEQPPVFQRLSTDLVEIDARLPIRELNQRLSVELPEGDDYETVGGFLFTALGKVPGVGDSFDHGRVHFEVVEASERRVSRLKVKVARPQEDRAEA